MGVGVGDARPRSRALLRAGAGQPAATPSTHAHTLLARAPLPPPAAPQALDRGAALVRAQRLATGHNADDVAETVLLNLLRGDAPRWVGGVGLWGGRGWAWQVAVEGWDT